jgi:hypothetical protein
VISRFRPGGDIEPRVDAGLALEFTTYPRQFFSIKFPMAGLGLRGTGRYSRWT